MAVDLNAIYALLLPICHAHGADVDEHFLEEIAATFEGGNDEFVEFVRRNAAKWYRSLGEPPEWMQEPDWQYFEGRPMVFVGAVQRGQETGLHDDAAFYVFWDPDTGVTETLIQLA